jgi:two-component system response regulator AtoC
MRKKRILIVDDEEMIRTLLFEALKSFGYEIETVENGIEAIKQICENNNYDLIITDFMMPEMNGLELIQKIRMMNLSIPIIVITAEGPENKLLKNGASACLKKPFNILELQRTLKDIIGVNKASSFSI